MCLTPLDPGAAILTQPAGSRSADIRAFFISEAVPAQPQRKHRWHRLDGALVARRRQTRHGNVGLGLHRTDQIGRMRIELAAARRPSLPPGACNPEVATYLARRIAKLSLTENGAALSIGATVRSRK